MMQIVLVLALVFAVGIALFAVQNTTPVAVSFLAWRAEDVAISVLVLVSAALGAGLALLLGIAREVRLRLRLRTQGQQLAAVQVALRDVEAGEPATQP
jgi:putative membrane protein